MGTISVNMRQMNRWQVTSDNVRWFEAIHRANGRLITLDARPYVEWLNTFNIFYTLKP